MIQSMTEIWGELFREPDLFRGAMWAILVLLFASGGYALLLLVRLHDQPTESGLAALGRTVRIPIRLAILAVLVSVLHLAVRQVQVADVLQKLGANVTPADLGITSGAMYRGQALGLLVAGLCFMLGYALDWIAEGRRIKALRESDRRDP